MGQDKPMRSLSELEQLRSRLEKEIKDAKERELYEKESPLIEMIDEACKELKAMGSKTFYIKQNKDRAYGRHKRLQVY